jgi:hypothetical protein
MGVYWGSLNVKTFCMLYYPPRKINGIVMLIGIHRYKKLRVSIRKVFPDGRMQVVFKIKRYNLNKFMSDGSFSMEHFGDPNHISSHHELFDTLTIINGDSVIKRAKRLKQVKLIVRDGDDILHQIEAMFPIPISDGGRIALRRRIGLLIEQAHEILSVSEYT